MSLELKKSAFVHSVYSSQVSYHQISGEFVE